MLEAAVSSVERCDDANSNRQLGGMSRLLKGRHQAFGNVDSHGQLLTNSCVYSPSDVPRLRLVGEMGDSTWSPLIPPSVFSFCKVNEPLCPVRRPKGSGRCDINSIESTAVQFCPDYQGGFQFVLAEEGLPGSW